jgi:hypothetical protein
VPVGTTLLAGAAAWRSMFGAARTPAWAKALGRLGDEAKARLKALPLPRWIPAFR